ncbi:MAG TPA: transcriptional repressor [Bacteriovoracaceae bacterium]|nr:transcriptional repressor [Bacteriovoracaceae bacterium]
MKSTCCYHKLTEDECKDLLTQNGINKTKSKISILLKLSESKEPLSAQQIFDELDSCDLSTVFRTLSQFKEKNLVQEVNLDEGFLRFQLILNDHHQHHHHFVRCRNCGKIAQIENCDLSIFEKAIKELGFTQMEHRLEFSGLCSRCS